MELPITLPNGEIVAGGDPIVIVGPNGSGKSRQARNLNAAAGIDFINALRNTRVPNELPAVGFDTAKLQFSNQQAQSRNNHWEMTSEFDWLLSNLLAEQSMAAMDFTQRFKENPETAGTPAVTPLSRVEELWGQVFPGRKLRWKDWKPLIVNESTGTQLEYSGNAMSDGEKAALFVAGRVFNAPSGVLVVDEPETHLHTQLAVRLWNALEQERQDIRFVYITHDLTFALSRRNATFLLANPTEGLRSVDISAVVPSDVAEALLGSASLSFYASRVVFCEGEAASLDSRLFGAWFSGPDTVVRPVGSSQRVLRCVDALRSVNLTTGLTAVGIIDGDYHPAAFTDSVADGVEVLAVHEVESLLCLPAVVEAVAKHVSPGFDQGRYLDALRSTVTDDQAHKIIIQRWKRRVEPHLEGLVASVSGRHLSVTDLVATLPQIFDQTGWTFSPEKMLEEEKDRVEAARTGSVDDFLKIIPGKQLLPIAARTAGLDVAGYVDIICRALGDWERLEALRVDLQAALTSHLPARYTSVQGAAAAAA